MDAVLIFDLNGNRIGSFDAKAAGATRRAVGTASANGKLYILNMTGNRVTAIDL